MIDQRSAVDWLGPFRGRRKCPTTQDDADQREVFSLVSVDLGLTQAAAFVSQKILSIWAIRSSRSCPLAGSMEPLVPLAPAALVARLNRSCSSGYFSKCGGLK